MLGCGDWLGLLTRQECLGDKYLLLQIFALLEIFGLREREACTDKALNKMDPHTQPTKHCKAPNKASMIKSDTKLAYFSRKALLECGFRRQHWSQARCHDSSAQNRNPKFIVPANSQSWYESWLAHPL